jgi:hypothetical protein
MSVDSTRMSLEDDVLRVRMSGSTRAAEMQQMFDMSEVLFQRHGYILMLIDAKGSKGLDPAARKLHTERLKKFIRPSYTAIYNVNPVARVMSTLIQRGIQLIAGKTFPVSFNKDEAEARAQLDIQRVVLRRAAVE